MDKIIISDTSCLIALSRIEKLDLLRDLYQEIIITKKGIVPDVTSLILRLVNKGFKTKVQNTITGTNE